MGSYVELLKACKEGSTKKVRKLLEICTDVSDVRDLTDKTLLHYCFQNEACADLILEAAPELLDVGDKHGYTVLHLASMIKPPVSLKYLLSKNPDINKRNNDSRSSLILAVIYDNWEAVKILCEHNAEVNGIDVSGVSPLHYAAKMKSNKEIGETKIIEILLQYGANIDGHDFFERSPLIWAVCSNNIVKLKYLIENGANKYSKDNNGLSILHYATSNGNIEILNLLLDEYEFNIETLDNNFCTALMYACTYNNQEVVQLLLEKGSNINAEDFKRRNAAYFACGKGDLKNLEILHQYDVNLWKLNNDSNYPLHEAAFKGHTEIVKFLLDKVNDKNMIPTLINHKNSNGQTPLHLSTARDNYDICKVLLECGADPNISLRVNKGKSMTALDLANQSEIKLIIKEYNGKSAVDLLKTSVINEERTASISEEYSEDSESDSMNSEIHDERKEVEDDCSEKGNEKISSEHNFESNENIDRRPSICNNLCSEPVNNDMNDTSKESNQCTTDITPGSTEPATGSTELRNSETEAYSKERMDITDEFISALLMSCKNGNVDEIRSFIDNGGNLSDIIDKNGRTLLHYSIKNKEAFQLIVDKAPELIHRLDVSNISVLAMIIMSKENDQLSLLLRNNADYNFPDCNGRTALHLSVVYNNLDALRLMDDQISDKSLFYHKADREGFYPLHYVVEICKVKKTICQCKYFIELLLKMNGDVECQDNVKRTPLLLAINFKNIEAAVTLLQNGANIMAKDNQNLCSIHYACSLGCLEILNELAIYDTFDPDIKDSKELTPIFYAISNCNEKIVKKLIELNARIDIIDQRGRNLCHQAAEKGAFKCLELLLSFHIDPWLKDNDGTMPLHEAAYRGYKEIAEILLNTASAADNVNVKNNSGQTALHLAALRNDCPMCFLLINKGSNINEVLHNNNVSEGVTAYDLATTPDCKETLRQYGGKSAKKIIESVNLETEFENLEELTLKNDNPIFIRHNSIRSTELALSTVPSINYTVRTSEISTVQVSNFNQHVPSPKPPSNHSKNSSHKRVSVSNSERSLLNSLLSDAKEEKPMAIEAENKISTYSNSDTQCKIEKISLRKPVTGSSGGTSSILSRETSKCTSSGISTKKTSSRTKSSKSTNKSITMEKEMQSRVQNSVLNYEYARLSCKIANDILRQKIREENVEKLKLSKGNKTTKTSK